MTQITADGQVHPGSASSACISIIRDSDSSSCSVRISRNFPRFLQRHHRHPVCARGPAQRPGLLLSILNSLGQRHRCAPHHRCDHRCAHRCALESAKRRTILHRVHRCAQFESLASSRRIQSPFRTPNSASVRHPRSFQEHAGAGSSTCSTSFVRGFFKGTTEFTLAPTPPPASHGTSDPLRRSAFRIPNSLKAPKMTNVLKLLFAASRPSRLAVTHRSRAPRTRREAQIFREHT